MDTASSRFVRYQEARDAFVVQWGAMGSAWGINRTMAQIHALLLVSAEPLSTDEVMEALSISRGNAHGNLRDLVQWQIVRSVLKKGDRKEYFEAEKDIWKMFCTITRERKRREVEPALEVLNRCAEASEEVPCPDCREFNRQMKQLSNFVDMIGGLMDGVSSADQRAGLRKMIELGASLQK